MTPDDNAVALTERVRRYYDNNAAAFERLGQGGASIHRAVWGPGVRTRVQAFHYVDELILAEVGGAKPAIVDLGCGLGASLIYLAGRADMRGEGITISAAQSSRAAELIAEAGAGGRVRVRQGDFLSVPEDLLGTADMAFSIEAFIHSPDAGRYFEQAAKTLRPGGRLVLCDDFLNSATPPDTPRGRRWMEEFRVGWHAGSLMTLDQVRDAAAAHGLRLVRDLDLTPYLELRRPRDRWISLLVRVGGVLRPEGPYWLSLVGGNALQWALLNGLLSYRFLELRKES